MRGKDKSKEKIHSVLLQGSVGKQQLGKETVVRGIAYKLGREPQTSGVSGCH